MRGRRRQTSKTGEWSMAHLPRLVFFFFFLAKLPVCASNLVVMSTFLSPLCLLLWMAVFCVSVCVCVRLQKLREEREAAAERIKAEQQGARCRGCMGGEGEV